jgi:hypothetical protein
MGGQQMPQSVAAAHHMLAMNGINPNSLNAQQLQNFVSSGPAAQQKSIATYSQNLQQQQGAQMGNKQMPNVPGPQNQGSPMQQQGPDGNMLNSYYNAGDMAGAAGMRPGAPGQQPPGSNHALQDYQMQLMLLEQQNKKRLMMARQEQDSMGGVSREGGPGPSPGGPGQPVPTGPNGQPFPDTSPQAMRTGTSPNPAEQMKRGTPQMNNNSGIPSPVPEGGQSRGSPNSMNFMGNHVDPKMAPHFFNGVDGNNMAAAQAQMNGMRPPGAHPGQPFNGQMNPQQMMAARQGQQPGPNGQQWQQGPNGQMQPQGMQQGQQPGQAQGTPQQRSMPPPSAPAQVAAANANRTTASPQQAAAAPPTPNQGNKAAPKKKESKAAKEKVSFTIHTALTVLIRIFSVPRTRSQTRTSPMPAQRRLRRILATAMQPRPQHPSLLSTLASIRANRGQQGLKQQGLQLPRCRPRHQLHHQLGLILLRTR